MSGSVRRDPNGVTWGYVFDAPRRRGGRRQQVKRRGFATQREAQRAMRAHQVRLDTEGTIVGGGTVLEFFVGYVNRLDGRAPSTILTYKTMVHTHLGSHPVAAKAIDRVTPGDVEAILDAARSRTGRGGQPLSSKTLRNLFNFLRSGFDQAARTDRIARNPMSGQVAPQVRRDPDSLGFWTAVEARRFLTFLEGTDDPGEAVVASIVELALLTGMRRGELLGLRWEDVDLARRTISVRQTRVGVGTDVLVGPPKTDLGRRTLGLAEPHLALLGRIRGDQDRYRALFGDRWVETGLVFTTAHGAGLKPDWVSQNFRRLVRASGLRLIRFHDLRHTHASLAIGNGEPIKAVSARLGHSDIGFTLRQYTHLLPEHHGLPAPAVIAALYPAGVPGEPITACDQTGDQTGPEHAVSPSGEGP